MGVNPRLCGSKPATPHPTRGLTRTCSYLRSQSDVGKPSARRRRIRRLGGLTTHDTRRLLRGVQTPTGLTSPDDSIAPIVLSFAPSFSAGERTMTKTKPKSGAFDAFDTDPLLIVPEDLFELIPPFFSAGERTMTKTKPKSKT